MGGGNTMDKTDLSTAEDIEIFEGVGEKIMSGSFRFTYNPKEEKFDAFIERFDMYWNQLRTSCLRKAARDQGLDIKFED